MSSAPPSPSQHGTRLILTSLPPSLTLPLLRAHLSRCPPHPPVLTDVKILSRPDGTSRRLGFLGFKTTQEAARVQAWTNGSWLDGTRGGSRIGCDWAQEAKDAPPPRKRSKPLVAPTESTSNLPSSTATLATTPAATDEAARFAEFMAVMTPRKKVTLASLKAEDLATGGVSRITPKQPLTREEARDVEDDDQVIGHTSAALVQPAGESQAVVEEVVDVVNDVEISDADYLSSRMKRKLEFDEFIEGEEDIERAHAEEEALAKLAATNSTPQFKVWESKELDLGEISASPAELERLRLQREEEGGEGETGDVTLDQAVKIIKESGRLFVRNLGFGITEEELQALFGEFGEVETIHIPLSPTRASKGLAYITYSTSTHAIAAFKALDRHSFQGRLLHILPAIIRNSKPEINSAGVVIPSGGIGEVSRGVKRDREDTRKKDTSGLGWGTLFMNSDAVVSSIAARLGISKSEILDPTASNAAVRVALAETHVIEETKKYFESEGIDLESFSLSSARMFSTLLIKNIPFGTSLSVLTALFTPFGPVARILLPPAGTIAVVEMADEASGKDAFRGLAFKQLGGSVLFIEKAPRGIWRGDFVKDKSLGLARTATTATTVEYKVTPMDADAEEEEGEKDSTLFIKNLSFASTTKTLTAAFSSLPLFSFARVQTKPDPKIPSGTLSMGFGFVGFKTAKAAASALRLRQGFELEGFKLEIKFAQRGKEEGETKKGKKNSGKKGKEGTGTKLIVKNVPFEVTRTEIRELFSAYGQLKSVRLPKKQDHKTRGFAFLEFISHNEAVAAFSALEHTHLLGRHLVLQWAEEGENELEELRKKTLAGFGKEKIGNRKEKFLMADKNAGSSGAGGGEDGTEAY